MKKFWQSKTFLFNVLAALFFVASHFGYADFAPDPEWMALVAAVLNVFLRFVTKVPVSW